ncbi:SDR family NAD(P)-dependent oxidoreductase [Candidatus Woesearchaeota archaeon]|nr:SDR family NAD(P)-dependent oxidoreductase [Candidatus Woesearchaeota archaeon]
MTKKILVTGSSGTIGTRLCERLIEKGYDVVGADWKPNKWNKDIDALTIIVDLRNEEELKKLPHDVDLIVHLAANARVYNLVVDPALARDNIMSTFNVMEFARTHHIKKVMFASSREVYGNFDKEVLSEKDVHIEFCESPYTASKICGEALVYSYNQCYGIDYIIVRFSNVYGMYDESDRLIPLFIHLCRENKDMEIFGEDKMLDFTYIDDAVNGVILCIERFSSAKNTMYNLAQGKGNSILEIAKMIKESLQKDVKISIKDNRPGEVVRYIADISKAKDKLGFSAKTTLAEGIQKSIEWYDKHSVTIQRS